LGIWFGSPVCEMKRRRIHMYLVYLARGAEPFCGK
jgi:hypothetical protein